MTNMTLTFYHHRLSEEKSIECVVFFQPVDYSRSLLTESTVELMYDCTFCYGRVANMPNVWFRLAEQVQIPLFSKGFFFLMGTGDNAHD